MSITNLTLQSSLRELLALALKQHSIPTLIVPLPFDRYNASLVSSIMEFAFSHRFPKEERGKEMRNFVVKFPFVTNSEGIKYPRSFVDIFEELLLASRKYENRIPYAIIQPYIINRKGKKCVLLNGRFHNFAHNHVKSSPQRSFAKDDELSPLAETFLQELALVCPATITSGLIRVDLMCYRGKIVVNEFESLEAMTDCENAGKKDKEMGVSDFLVRYWKDLITTRVIRQL